MLHLQGGDMYSLKNCPTANTCVSNNNYVRLLDDFKMGPNLVRGFQPAGIGPRDITPGTTNDALGGTMYWGASFEMQYPLYFLPKDSGFRGAVFVDSGSVWGYRGETAEPGDRRNQRPHHRDKSGHSAANASGPSSATAPCNSPTARRCAPLPAPASSGIRRSGRCALISPIRSSSNPTTAPSSSRSAAARNSDRGPKTTPATCGILSKRIANSPPAPSPR